MANIFTAKHKRPRTQYLSTYVQWNDAISNWRTPVRFYVPHLPPWPLPPYKRFRPMPLAAEPGAPEPDRNKPHERRGLKTPEQSFHLGCDMFPMLKDEFVPLNQGYKHFHRDPSTKKLLVLDAEKPLPHPLVTETRVQFQNPHRLPHLIIKQNTARYGLPLDRRPAIGAVPRLVSIPPKHLEDDPTWQRDCHT